MGVYSLETLVRKWGRGELTVEQAIGQILLHVQDLKDTVTGLERRIYRWPPENGDDDEEDGS
ncbi:MAG: hypothetical protein ACE5LU_19725 [Anaerolineae bacterium]